MWRYLVELQSIKDFAFGLFCVRREFWGKKIGIFAAENKSINSYE